MGSVENSPVLSKSGAPMAFIRVTRLRIRSKLFLAAFALDFLRTRREVMKARGFRGGSLLADRSWTFWTLTAWDDQSSMRHYTANGAHRVAMPRLLDWCDEASVVHWEQFGDDLPSWEEAGSRIRLEGRPSKVRNPSANHASLSFKPSWTLLAGPIAPKKNRQSK
jgi:hypothetical protein